jgi:phospholipid transport system transporter-binding protein
MKKAAAAIAENKGILLVSGELNFDTVSDLLNNSLPLLAKHPQLFIDLSQVTTVNSASLALLLEWLKYAKRNNKPIIFKGISTQLRSIADIAGVTEMFCE